MKFRAWIALFAVCVLITAALAFAKYRQISAAIAFAESFPEPSETVQLYIVDADTWLETVTVNAEVVATQSIELRNELPGKIVRVGFQPGASVSAGQILLELDISEEKAQLEAAEASEEIAELALARNRKLVEAGAGSQEARDNAIAQRRSAAASKQALQAVIDKKTLRAPFDANTGLHQLEPGQYLDGGSLITRLVGTTPNRWIDFSVPPHQAGLAIGDTVDVAHSRDKQTTISSRIIARDAWVDENSRNIRFRALVENAPDWVLPGSLVTVKLPLGDERQVSRVPVTAIRRSAFGANVYRLVPSEDGAHLPERAQLQPVTLGAERDRHVIVTEGLSIGDRIAATGAFKLRDGMLVNAVDNNGGE